MANPPMVGLVEELRIRDEKLRRRMAQGILSDGIKSENEARSMEHIDLCIYKGKDNIHDQEIQETLFRHGYSWNRGERHFIRYSLPYIFVDCKSKTFTTDKYQENVKVVYFKDLQRYLKGENSMFNSMRKYLEQNKNVIFTLVGIALLDEWILQGRLRGRLQTLVDRMFGICEKKLLEGDKGE